MKERSRTSSDRASMSGEMLAFIAIMGFIVSFFVALLFFPKAFNFVWYGGLTFAYNAFMWMMTGWRAPIAVYGTGLILVLLFAGGAFLVLEWVYKNILRRTSTEKTREDWNEYRIK